VPDFQAFEKARRELLDQIVFEEVRLASRTAQAATGSSARISAKKTLQDHGLGIPRPPDSGTREAERWTAQLSSGPAHATPRG